MIAKISDKNNSAKIDNCLNSTLQKSEIWCCIYNNLTLGITENQSTDWVSNPLSFRRKKNEQRQELVQFGSSQPDQTTVPHLGSNFFVTVKKRPYTTMQHIEQFLIF